MISSGFVCVAGAGAPHAAAQTTTELILISQTHLHIRDVVYGTRHCLFHLLLYTLYFQAAEQELQALQ